MMRLLVAVSVLAGCGRSSEDKFLADAKAQVRTFFAAAATDDCKTIRALADKVKSESDCRELLGMWHQDAIALVDVLGAERDGRDARAAIVRVRMQTKGRERELLFRAVRHSDRWAIVF